MKLLKSNIIRLKIVHISLCCWINLKNCKRHKFKIVALECIIYLFTFTHVRNKIQLTLIAISKFKSRKIFETKYTHYFYLDKIYKMF